MKAIILDIDGVLNQSGDQAGQLILPHLVGHLNEIIVATGVDSLVICSAWRRLILRRDMRNEGFTVMLRSHGCIGKVIGHTIEGPDDQRRKDQIFHFLQSHSHIEHFVLLDDFPDALGGDWRHVKVDGTAGLSPENVKSAVGILEGQK